jgi:hypothetical protein
MCAVSKKIQVLVGKVSTMSSLPLGPIAIGPCETSPAFDITAGSFLHQGQISPFFGF